jgi:hypothetical protein
MVLAWTSAIAPPSVTKRVPGVTGRKKPRGTNCPVERSHVDDCAVGIKPAIAVGAAQTHRENLALVGGAFRDERRQFVLPSRTRNRCCARSTRPHDNGSSLDTNRVTTSSC